ncbi:MAG: TIGR04551 family protein [Deltaproteobacteria bacterium]|nr:TIGR04551 family protein [Deltaproteobacteria bacterium]
MSKWSFGLVMAASCAVVLAPAGLAAQPAPGTEVAAPLEADTGETAEEPATPPEGLPEEPATPPPPLAPPDETYFGEPPAGPTPGETGGTTGETGGTGAGTGDDAGTGEPGTGEPENPAEALLAASHEQQEDREAEEDAEQVSWQEEASRFIELKGYFRTRGDLFYQLHLGRPAATGPGDVEAFPHPYDDGVNSRGGVCGLGETCFTNDTYAGANLRLRLEPVIHLSSYVQVFATIDVLDNLVLGSTPDGYASVRDGSTGEMALSGRNPWVPLRAFSATQVPPVSGINSFQDSITAKRAWAEVTTPIGRLMFGRMQSQWGLGILANGGNDIDSDYGDLADRIMWAARYEGLIGALGFDFAGEGPTSQAIFQLQGQPWDLGQLDDVNQYIAVLGYRPTEEEQLERLRNGAPAYAGGMYYVFRNQVLSSEGTDLLGNQGNLSLVQRDAWAHIFDVWFQLRWERFRAETEWTVIYGGIENISLSDDVPPSYDVLQFGGVLQLEYTLLGQPTVRSNRLRIGLEGGYASGDPNEDGLTPANGLIVQNGPPGTEGLTTLSRFGFDPDFNVDLILFEQILGRVSAAYYVRPWVDYTLALGAGRSKKFLNFRLDVVWSRASEFVSTISNAADLGLELDASVTFDTADNFIARIQYGVFFPFGAFEDQSDVAGAFTDLSNAQTVQALLGVTF